MAPSDAAYDHHHTDAALAAGLSLCDGQFTLTEQIGLGGFGITYKAEDNVLGRTVVVKECFPEDFCIRYGVKVIPRNEQHAKQFQSIVAMFMREARSLAKLRHPNIVGVHRAFEENNTAYMVLDLIEGEDLLDVFDKKDGSLTPQVVQDMLLTLLKAVEKVHDMDLLHRDIAPDNIMIDKAGTPVLIDFGAARGDASRKTRAMSSLLVVKDGYSPPEFYVAGSQQTPSSDLFALGASFYHLLTGKPPPHSQARMTDMASGKDDPCRPLAGLVTGYPKPFLDAIELAMKIAPDDRLQSAAQWREMVTARTVQDTPKATAKTPDQPSKNLAEILGRPLTDLIEETNTVVRKTRIIEDAPKVVEAPEPAPKVPDWVAEFNKETEGEGISVNAVEDAPMDDEPVETSSRPIQVKRPRTRLADTSRERRTSGWAVEAIQQRERIKSEGHSTTDTPEDDQSPPELDPIFAHEPQDGWLKPLVRMSLMGIFFGITVFVATTTLMNGGI